MHRPSKILGCHNLPTASSIVPYTITICDYLDPAVRHQLSSAPRRVRSDHDISEQRGADTAEALFYRSLSRASQSHTCHRPITRTEARLVGIIRRTTHCKEAKAIITSNGQRRSVSHDAQQHEVKRARETEPQPLSRQRRKQKAAGWDFFDSNTLDFAQKSRLPLAFFHDLNILHEKVAQRRDEQGKQNGQQPSPAVLKEQMDLVESVRKLEEKLAKAKTSLNDSLLGIRHTPTQVAATSSKVEPKKVVLTKDDYRNLVDLYFHTHTSRFDPESPHSSPTPTFLEDYAFKLSEDFAPPQAYSEFHDDENYESPLKEVERMLRTNKLREVSAFKAFVDVLLDDYSSNAALYTAYKQLPQPGVGFLPKGTVRLLLQRMSTPWQKSEKSMIRYLSLIDDMQTANLPINQAEWASAIYLAGRSFSKVTDSDLNTAMRLWKQMEQEAGVKAHNVTFNILFDIAVRANKYPLAQMILKEMHDRGLQLNRLGRVSVIYYHGLRCDGDAVRKAYRDFVDAGEIVDTLVLNCVMAALYNAQEPTAAEQIYERMKNLHVNTRRETRPDGSTAYYRQYPGPGEDVIDRKLAVNALHRTLLHSRRLKDILPEHHKALQEIIPLRPDHVTYRTMISYHANVSGNLNRITVLINEMSGLFGLPMQSMHYQLLFKGFALHGATRNPHATWSLQRLNMAWESCRQEIKDGLSIRRRIKMANLAAPQLPSIKLINEDASDGDHAQPNTHQRRSEWDEFVLDLAAFPRERRKHIERIHAELFDEEQEKKELFILNPFARHPTKDAPPKRQEHYYPLGERRLDEQEGEYVLPSPFLAIHPSSAEFEDRFFPEKAPSETQTNYRSESTDSDADTFDAPKSSSSPGSELPSDAETEHESEDSPDLNLEEEEEHDHPPLPTNTKYQVEATKSLVCWLLRAYANATGSRAQLEEIWNSMRKLWRSQDPNDQAAVLRVMRRCLRNCDRFGPPM